MLAALEQHRVDYVLIGGFAAQQHGAMRRTEDIDVTPATDLDNLERLAAALKQMHARIRVNDIPEGLPFDTSAEALRGVKMLNLRTPHGDFDLAFDPAGIAGYADLARSCTFRDIDGIAVAVASLEDIIRSKTAAGRRKDEQALPELRELAAARNTLGASQHKSHRPPPDQ